MAGISDANYEGKLRDVEEKSVGLSETRKVNKRRKRTGGSEGERNEKQLL